MSIIKSILNLIRKTKNAKTNKKRDTYEIQNKRGNCLYVGSTTDIARRTKEHKRISKHGYYFYRMLGKTDRLINHKQSVTEFQLIKTKDPIRNKNSYKKRKQ